MGTGPSLYKLLVYLLGLGYLQQPEEHVSSERTGQKLGQEDVPSIALEGGQKPKNNQDNDGRQPAMRWMVYVFIALLVRLLTTFHRWARS